MGSTSSSGDNTMKKLLEKSKKLPKWVQQIIQKNYDGIWRTGSDGYLYLDGRWKDYKITDEMIPELLQCIELIDDRVKKLVLSTNRITSKGAVMLFDGLKQMNSRVSGIYLCDNEFDDECMKSLGEFIQNSKTIENIDISINKITDKGIEILLEYSEGNRTLKILNLSENKGITDQAVVYLIDIIQKSAITLLPLFDTSISDKKQKEIKILVAINQIKCDNCKIDLSSSSMTDEDIEILSEYLEGNETVKNLCLFENKGITDKSVVCLIDIVQKSAITLLELFETSISEENQREINNYLSIPVDEREIPIKSKSKSAAKIN